MNPRNFHPQQAIEVRDAFQSEGVDYLFLGKSGAILLGYPSTTQDVDLFVPKDKINAEKLILALEKLGFEMDEDLKESIKNGKDFIQLKTGPFDLDLIHGPDGIESFAEAKQRAIVTDDGFQVTHLKDIIASKKAAGRAKDKADLELLEAFEQEYAKVCKQKKITLRSASDLVLERTETKKKATQGRTNTDDSLPGGLG